MFNAVCKIPDAVLYSAAGRSLFVFYQFEQPPVVFNQAAWQFQLQHDPQNKLRPLEREFAEVHATEGAIIKTGLMRGMSTMHRVKRWRGPTPLRLSSTVRRCARGSDGATAMRKIRERRLMIRITSSLLLC